MEGPRGLEEREIPSAAELANVVFRNNSTYKMEDEYPLLFSRDNLDDMRVFVDAGKVVSLVGMSIKDVVIMGCRLRTASIGSVCTSPEYRNRGLATKLMEDATQRALDEGVVVMLISGGRGLYRRLGCINAGLYKSFFVRRDQLSEAINGLVIRKYDEEDIVDLVKLHQLEPIRFLRPYEDFKVLLATKRLCDRVSETYVIENGGVAVAYVCLQLPETKGKPLIIEEFAGSRMAVLTKLGGLMDEEGTESAVIDIPSADIVMEHLLFALGVKESKRGFMGTVKLIDANGFFENIDTYITEILGAKRRKDLAITCSANKPELTFEYAKERLNISGCDRITAFVFGTIEEPLQVETDEVKATVPELGKLLTTIFPMPLVDYGLNYV